MIGSLKTASMKKSAASIPVMLLPNKDYNVIRLPSMFNIIFMIETNLFKDNRDFNACNGCACHWDHRPRDTGLLHTGGEVESCLVYFRLARGQWRPKRTSEEYWRGCYPQRDVIPSKFEVHAMMIWVPVPTLMPVWLRVLKIP